MSKLELNFYHSFTTKYVTSLCSKSFCNLEEWSVLHLAYGHAGRKIEIGAKSVNMMALRSIILHVILLHD